MFSTKSYPLGTAWVVDLADTDNLRGAFKLVTPEETLVLFSPNKREWMELIDRSIAALLVMDESGIPNIRLGMLLRD